MNHEQLITLTQQCNEALRAEYALFGWEEDAAALKPADARVLLPILAAVHAPPPCAAQPTPTPNPLPIQTDLPQNPKPTPNGHVGRRRAPVAPDFAERVRAELHRLAVDGVMCTQAQWAEGRDPSLPQNIKIVYNRLRIQTMAELAEWAGLSPRLHDYAAMSRLGHANQRPAQEEAVEPLLAALRALSPDGTLLSQDEWNERKPETFATATALCKRLGKSWGELAQMAGLSYDPQANHSERVAQGIQRVSQERSANGQAPLTEAQRQQKIAAIAAARAAKVAKRGALVPEPEEVKTPAQPEPPAVPRPQPESFTVRKLGRPSEPQSLSHAPFAWGPVRDALRAASKGGVLVSAVEWDARKNDRLPTMATIMRGMGWRYLSQVADACGLRANEAVLA